jgi:glycyl-tRNA synthetase
MEFLLAVGLAKTNIVKKKIEGEELAHYSKGTYDFEYKFPFGQKELMGVANRGDYDLLKHAEHSKTDFSYIDPYTNEKYVPFVIEPSIGVERLMLAILIESMHREKVGTENRIVLKLKKELAPYKVCVLPLVTKLGEETMKLFMDLKKELNVPMVYDKAGTIGKRYRRQDAIGTPNCITFDYDSLEDKSVTIRDRDTMEQKRVKISELSKELSKLI